MHAASRRRASAGRCRRKPPAGLAPGTPSSPPESACVVACLLVLAHHPGASNRPDHSFLTPGNQLYDRSHMRGPRIHPAAGVLLALCAVTLVALDGGAAARPDAENENGGTLVIGLSRGDPDN